MKMYIPACGHRIVLTKDWTFKVYDDYRTTSLHELRDARKMYTFKSGTKLEIDRVYIRQQNKTAKSINDDYDSVTFKVISDNKKERIRFWAKLVDVNNIEFDVPEDALDGIKNAKATKKFTAQTIIGHLLMIYNVKFDFSNKIKDKNPAWKSLFDIDCKNFDKQFLTKLSSAQASTLYPPGLPNYLRHNDVAHLLLMSHCMNSYYRDVTTTTDSNGNKIRKFVLNSYATKNFYVGMNNSSVSFQGAWLEIMTDKNDMKILSVKCGW